MAEPNPDLTKTLAWIVARLGHANWCQKVQYPFGYPSMTSGMRLPELGEVRCSCGHEEIAAALDAGETRGDL
jgi:hypothetical protein